MTTEITEARRKLPIYEKKEEFLELLSKHQVLICVGETGSGKSTQIPQYLYEAGYAKEGRIACTQPRRIAAKALAMRVAFEMGCELGKEVGYQIRFDNKTEDTTLISYMTEGVLLQFIASDRKLESYSAVILDEAHQRNMHTDVLFGLLKRTLKRNKDLKLIVTSATLDDRKFSAYFDHAHVFNVTGRMFPVETLYPDDVMVCDEATIFYDLLMEMDIHITCLRIVKEIHRDKPPGDILVFLSGQDEIDKCCDNLSSDSTLCVLPCYGALSMEEQYRALEPAPNGLRKVVVATNIAETSLTIDGIVYVIDSGRAKVITFGRNGVHTLVLQCISQAEAQQRRGRAARTRPGQVYRLYSERYHNNEMPQHPVPEILRRNLESVVLDLAACGVEDLTSFDFLDPPRQSQIAFAVSTLQDLGALSPDGHLLFLGRVMSSLPVDPRLAKILIASAAFHCSEEIIIIVSILSARETAGEMFLKPRKKSYQAAQRHALLYQDEGDHITFLSVFEIWVNHNYSEEWCKENFVNFTLLEEARNIQTQIRDIMKGHKYYSDGGSCSSRSERVKKIQGSLAAGFFHHIAMKVSDKGYRTYYNAFGVDEACIHPSSALSGVRPQPDWVIYDNMMETGRIFLKRCMVVDPAVIKRQAPNFYQKMLTVLTQEDSSESSSSSALEDEELDLELFCRLKCMK